MLQDSKRNCVGLMPSCSGKAKNFFCFGKHRLPAMSVSAAGKMLPEPLTTAWQRRQYE